MATLEERVENYTGEQSEDFGSYLTSAAQVVLDMVPKQKLRYYASDTRDSGSGVDIDGKRLAYVSKGGRQATEHPPGMKEALQDSESIHEATAFSPAFVIDGTKVFVYPNGGKVFTVSYPSISQSDTGISNFPDELEEAVVALAAKKFTVKDDDFEKVPHLDSTYDRIIKGYLGTNPEE